MGTAMYYMKNMVLYWRRFINLIRNRSEWHLSEIKPDELHERINSDLADPLLIDVRSVQEFNGADGHIPNAMSIPIRELSSQLKDLQSYIYDHKEREIVTLCPGGGMSLIAVDILIDADFTNVKSLHGGLDLWKKNGYPLTTTS